MEEVHLRCATLIFFSKADQLVEEENKMDNTTPVSSTTNFSTPALL